MGTILAIMAVPVLGATGIYNPPVMRDGQCIAQPGSFDSLYCPALPTPKLSYKKGVSGVAPNKVAPNKKGAETAPLSIKSRS